MRKFSLLIPLCFISKMIVAANITLASVNIDGYAIQTQPLYCVVKSPQSTITSFKINFSVDGGTAITQSITGVNIEYLAYYRFALSSPAVFSSTGVHNITVWTSDPNNLNDTNKSDDTLKKTVVVLTFAPFKVIPLETFVGEWCGYCPDGDYKAQLDEDSFPGHVVTIAYHSTDPYAINESYNLAEFYNVVGYPTGMIDRFEYAWQSGPVLNRVDWFHATDERLQYTVPADIVLSGATVDTVTKHYSVKVTTNFYGAASGTYALRLIITEDSIISQGQKNYYNDGSIDPNSPFVGLGDPIVNYAHNNVARLAVAAPSSTIPLVIPSSGGSYSYTFSGTLGSDWNWKRLNYVGMLWNDTGYPDNSFVINCGALNIATAAYEVNESAFELSVAPNPVNDDAAITFSASENMNVGMKLFDAMGICRRTFFSQTFASGGHQLFWNGKDDAQNNLPAGIYFLVLSDGDHFITKKVFKN